MEALIKNVIDHLILFTEAGAGLIIGYGAVEAMVSAVIAAVRQHKMEERREEEIRHRFGKWLLLGLEFTLAADILQTAIAPSWEDIGRLAAIAAIRTALNFFLQREMEHTEKKQEDQART